MTIDEIVAAHTDVPAHHAPYLVQANGQSYVVADFRSALERVREESKEARRCRAFSDTADGSDDSGNPSGLTLDEQAAFELAAEVDHD